ncbi:MAG: hypothetical protein HUU14_05870 [Dehalococcoidia bacterium]|nr:hypothetical protein [Dehalococcoidia bacterium]NUQ55392.1 hypothetical protein [Dehalococcoidia bacterium]
MTVARATPMLLLISALLLNLGTGGLVRGQTPVPAPQGVQASAGDVKREGVSVEITWKPVEGATGYQVERSAVGKPPQYDWMLVGEVAVAGEGETTAFVLNIEELLWRVGEAGEFEIPAGVVLDGPQDLLLGGEQGKYSDRPWVGLAVRGNWHPDNGQPMITDASGSAVELAHVQVGYQKDANGNILEGSTAIGFFVDGDVGLRRLTIVLGPRSAIDPASHSATLIPMPGQAGD